MGYKTQSYIQSQFKSKPNEKFDGLGGSIKKNKEGNDGNNIGFLSPPGPAVRTGLRMCFKTWVIVCILLAARLAHLFLRPPGCWVVSESSARNRVRTALNLSQSRRLFCSLSILDYSYMLVCVFLLSQFIVCFQKAYSHQALLKYFVTYLQLLCTFLWSSTLMKAWRKKTKFSKSLMWWDIKGSGICKCVLCSGRD